MPITRRPLIPTLNTVVVTNPTAASIQAAIDANKGKTIFVDGNVTLTSTLTIGDGHTYDRTQLDGNGVWTAGFTNGPMVRVLNADYCSVGSDGSSLFFDGDWQTGIIAVQLMGAIAAHIHVTGDRLPVGVDLDSDNVAAVQNSAFNHIWIVIRNGVKALSFKGKSGQHCADNVVEEVRWWGAASVASTGIDFVQYADNNDIKNAYLNLTAANHVGLVYNSASPSTDVEVYENRFDGIIESSSGAKAIDGNRTFGTVGQYPSVLRVRLSGSLTRASIDLQSDSDIVFKDSNMNGVQVGPIVVPQAARNFTVRTGGTSSTAEQDMITWTMPAYSLVAGGFLELDFSGWVLNLAAGVSNTFKFLVYCGGVSLLTSMNNIVPNNDAKRHFQGRLQIAFPDATHAQADFSANFNSVNQNEIDALVAAVGNTGEGTSKSGVNLAASQVVKLTGQWSVSNANTSWQINKSLYKLWTPS